jgi:hypothetical protein
MHNAGRRIHWQCSKSTSGTYPVFGHNLALDSSKPGNSCEARVEGVSNLRMRPWRRYVHNRGCGARHCKPWRPNLRAQLSFHGISCRALCRASYHPFPGDGNRSLAHVRPASRNPSRSFASHSEVRSQSAGAASLFRPCPLPSSGWQPARKSPHPPVWAQTPLCE